MANQIKFADLHINDEVRFLDKSKSCKYAPSTGVITATSPMIITIKLTGVFGRVVDPIVEVRRSSLVLHRRVHAGEGKYLWAFE